MTDDRPTEIRTLYRQAFRDFGSVALGSMRPVEEPARADVLAITAALRTHGRMDGRRLAERIEEACRSPNQRTGKHAAGGGWPGRPSGGRSSGFAAGTSATSARP